MTENEFAMMQLAATLGIDTPEVRLIQTAEIVGLPQALISQDSLEPTLAVRRFDRAPGGQRLHMEDMAQVFERWPEAKYDGVSYGNIARLLWLEAGETSLCELIRRLVFCAAIGNGDMHLKNWSILYKDGVVPTLAPAYDLLSTKVYLPDEQQALSFAGSKRFVDLDRARLERLARKAELPEHSVKQTALDMVERFHAIWPDYQERLSSKVNAVISQQLKQVPLFQGR